MSKAPMTRREKQKLSHRQEILDAALVLFSEYGFHNVTMQQVADRAEFSIGTLYNFFENKEDLYATLMDDLSKRFFEALTQAINTGPDEPAKLRNYVSAKASVFSANLDIVRLYFRETRGVSLNVKAGLDDEIRQRHADVLRMLCKVFADGIRNKRFRAIADPYYLALTLESLTSSTLLGCLEDPENPLYPADPDVLLDILFKGLLIS